MTTCQRFTDPDLTDIPFAGKRNLGLALQPKRLRQGGPLDPPDALPTSGSPLRNQRCHSEGTPCQRVVRSLGTKRISWLSASSRAKTSTGMMMARCNV